LVPLSFDRSRLGRDYGFLLCDQRFLSGQLFSNISKLSSRFIIFLSFNNGKFFCDLFFESGAVSFDFHILVVDFLILTIDFFVLGTNFLISILDSQILLFDFFVEKIDEKEKLLFSKFEIFFLRRWFRKSSSLWSLCLS